MSKYKLHFTELNFNGSIPCLEFTSARKRESFIADRVIGNNHRKVFTLITNYSEEDDDLSDVYVFDKFICIKDVVRSKWEEFWLFEWESYEDAYKNALDLKEVSPLCYDNSKDDVKPPISISATDLLKRAEAAKGRLAASFSTYLNYDAISLPSGEPFNKVLHIKRKHDVKKLVEIAIEELWGNRGV